MNVLSLDIRCERPSASEGAVTNGLRGRGTQTSERSERISITGSPGSGEQLTGAPPVGPAELPHMAMVHQ
jgi:hypothetical protein